VRGWLLGYYGKVRLCSPVIRPDGNEWPDNRSISNAQPNSFDPQLLGNLYATPAFQRDFGYKFNGEWIISAPWQTGLSMGSPIGQVVGAFFASYPMEWFGRKKTFGACVVVSTGFIFIQFFARSLPVLLAGELLGGLVWLLL
jgi:SP family general alpha glucoside:H+ symporter-like MFS transporter